MSDIIDLSLAYHSQMPGFSSSVAKTLQSDGWNASDYHIYSHAGTHMDASVHFGVGNQTIDTIPPERCMGNAWMADVNPVEDKQVIDVESLGWVKEKITPGDNLIIKTGWAKFVNEPRYRNALPRIGEALAHWLVENKINMVGVEPPSVADVNNIEEVTRIHRILFEGDILIIEGLTNLEKVNGANFHLIALPVKVQGGDGAPVRVLAMET